MARPALVLADRILTGEDSRAYDHRDEDQCNKGQPSKGEDRVESVINEKFNIAT